MQTRAKICKKKKFIKCENFLYRFRYNVRENFRAIFKLMELWNLK